MDYIKYYEGLVNAKDYNIYDVDSESYFGPISSPVEILNVIDRYKIKGGKFIDIGCGYGHIINTIQKMDMKSYGVEINENLKEHISDFNVFFIDIIKEYFNFSEYDIIYLYRPIKDKDKCDLLLDKIINNSKDGSIIIYLLPHFNKNKVIQKTEKLEYNYIHNKNLNNNFYIYNKMNYCVLKINKKDEKR